MAIEGEWVAVSRQHASRRRIGDMTGNAKKLGRFVATPGHMEREMHYRKLCHFWLNRKAH